MLASKKKSLKNEDTDRSRTFGRGGGSQEIRNFVKLGKGGAEKSVAKAPQLGRKTVHQEGDLQNRTDW